MNNLYPDQREISLEYIESCICFHFKMLGKMNGDCHKPTKYKIRGANRLQHQLFCYCALDPDWLGRLFLLILLSACFDQADKKPKHLIKTINLSNEPIFLTARLSSPLFNESKENLCLTPSTANTLQASANLKKVRWML